MKGRKIMEYVKPEIEITEFGTQDVITGSISNTGDVDLDITWPTN